MRALTRAPAIPIERGECVTGDLLVEGVLGHVFEGADTVVHLAGPNEVRAAADPEGTICDVAAGALRVAKAANVAGVRQIVYLSTVHVYGARLRPGSEVDEDTPCEPRAAYTIARLAAEQVLAGYSDAAVVVLRLTNSVGAPGGVDVDRWSLVANDLCRQAATTGRLVLRSDGTQWRDFVALSDVCDVVSRIASACRARSPPAPTTSARASRSRSEASPVWCRTQSRQPASRARLSRRPHPATHLRPQPGFPSSDWRPPATERTHPCATQWQRPSPSPSPTARSSPTRRPDEHDRPMTTIAR